MFNMGYCDGGAVLEKFKKGFDETISRGPDDSRIIDTGKGLLGFHRLAIMGLTEEGMQPFGARRPLWSATVKSTDLQGSGNARQKRDTPLKAIPTVKFCCLL